MQNDREEYEMCDDLSTEYGDVARQRSSSSRHETGAKTTTYSLNGDVDE